MNVTSQRDAEDILAVEAGLQDLAPLFRAGAHLPEAGELLRRARVRRRQLAAERLARWQSRFRSAALGGLVVAGVATALTTGSRWAGWLLQPILVRPPMPSSTDAAVLAGAMLASSIAVIWVVQQFADE